MQAVLVTCLCTCLVWPAALSPDALGHPGLNTVLCRSLYMSLVLSNQTAKSTMQGIPLLRCPPWRSCLPCLPCSCQWVSPYRQDSIL